MCTPAAYTPKQWRAPLYARVAMRVNTPCWVPAKLGIPAALACRDLARFLTGSALGL
jgi:hypothetical protein